MFYLLLATLCSAAIALIFKHTENSSTNRYVITSANYFMAFLTSLGMIFYKRLFAGVTRTESFVSELKLILVHDTYIFSQYSSIIWGILVGAVFGGFFFFSFIYYQKSVKENGVGISGTFAKLGILVPMIFSIILWREFPSIMQWVGVIISLAAILIVNSSTRSLEQLDFNPNLIFLFLFGGMAEFSNKIYQQYALNAYKDVFLFSIFFVAFLISINFTLRDRAKFTGRDILTGFAVGVPNLFSSYFLILSLDTVKTSVAFPAFSVGSILLINIGGFLIFKERISNKNKLAIGLILIALALLNI